MVSPVCGHVNSDRDLSALQVGQLYLVHLFTLWISDRLGVSGYDIFALTKSSLMFLGRLYATVGFGGNSSLSMGDDISLGQCVCIILVRLGMPVPYVVIRGIGAISTVDVAFPSCSSLSLSSCCTLFRDSSNILSE